MLIRQLKITINAQLTQEKNHEASHRYHKTI